jgi:prepilin-type N-terminal cleavage/methylation domain-containing protein
VNARTRSPARRAGLSLVEMLIAVAIASGGLTMLVAAANRCLSVIKKAKIYDDCRHLYAEVERAHPLQLDELEEGVDSGNFEGEFAQYSWEREVRLFTVEEDDGVYTIATRIRWDARARERYEEFVTLLHLPSAKRLGFVSRKAVDK